MKTIYSQDFEGLSLADLNGQDSWFQGTGHTGGSIDVIAGQVASLSISAGNSVDYERIFDQALYPGQYHESTFVVQVNSTLTGGAVGTWGFDPTGTIVIWEVDIDNTTGNVTVWDKTGSHITGSSVSLDAPHTVKVVINEAMDLEVFVDTVSVYTGTVVGKTYYGLGFYFGAIASTIANVAHWDDVLVQLRDSGTIFKIFVGH